MLTECSRPAWFTQLERDLNATVLVVGAAIDWDRCRDLFLIPLLQRLELRSNSPHPAIVRGLLERRLAGEGENVTAELSAAAAATAWATATAASATAWAATDAERKAQLADLQAAIAASTQPLAGDQLPSDNDGTERELLHRVRLTELLGFALDALFMPGHVLTGNDLKDACLLSGRLCPPFWPPASQLLAPDSTDYQP
jgi:hypothetical protein